MNSILRTITLAAVFGLGVFGLQAQISNATITGPIAAASDDCSTVNSCVTLNGLALNFQSATIQTTGNGLGVYVFEGTANGNDWTPLRAVRVGAISALARSQVTAAQAAGAWTVEASGLTAIRVRGKQIIRPDIAVTIQMSEARFQP